MSEAIYHHFSDGPKSVAPYSHAVESGDFLFLTGQMPYAADGTVPDGIEAQTRQVWANLCQVRSRAGFGDAEILSVRVFLTKFERHYERMNKVYASFFPDGPYPARTCVGVSALAGGCDIEMDLIARKRC
jgi:2-iminobutanoate/2-iminopropanoate deaminase